ncbi:site-2 protease family protein [Endozoicomonas atrinae]|uniref:site-2 protease family protein n=1 Tax=Endozoicomonas atrinae TaxID=1333660 RepID=UPI0008269326|nr:site-2 protease family protein [Endozoicomonas atrinae]
MFIRIPLFDPDKLLQRIGPLLRPLFSIYGLLFWFIIVLLGLKTAAENIDVLFTESNGLLAPDNLFLLYISIALVKTLHEFGHAIVCRHYSGEVHTIGVIFILLIPLPYMDATSSWSFKRSWQRVFVGAAGMIVELWLAAIAAMVWANTGSGVVNSLAYNIMFIASVSTVLFNGNPLLRFDAYYMLSDALDIPNLFQRSQKQVTYLVEKFYFGCKQLVSPAHSTGEAIYLSLYAVLSTLYRFAVMVAIVLYIADKYLILGLIMAALSIFLWVVPPPIKLVKYLKNNPRIARRRSQAIRRSLGFITVLMLAISFIPVPNNIRVPGIVEATEYTHLNTQTEGFLSEVLAQEGAFIEQGTPLIRLENRDLLRQIKTISLQIQENQLQLEKARAQESSDLAPLLKKQQSLKKHVETLSVQQEELIITAPISGVWEAPDIHSLKGSWIERGKTIGTLYSLEGYRFSAVVLQNDNGRLFQEDIQRSEVRLKGQEYSNISLQSLDIFPFHSEQLPSAALGWQGGGKLATRMDDQSGVRSEEPFLQVYAELPEESNALYYHGVSGVLRIGLPPEPLARQWYRQINQLLQKRYKI